jgi:branched-chain amino acid transport system substrate-binding protein
MLAKQINAKGGIKGRPVKVEFYDDAGKPDQAAQACSRLLDNKDVVAIIGPTLTGPSLAITSMCEKAKVPLVSCAASIKIVAPVKPYVFKTAQSDSLVAGRLLDYLKTKQIKKVAFIYDSNAFGSSGRDQWMRVTKGSGVDNVAFESFGSSDTDMTSQLTSIRSKKPDAVVCWGTNPGPAIVAKNMRTLGMNIPLFMSHGIGNSQFITLAGAAANGVIFPGGKLLVASVVPTGDLQKRALLKYTTDYTKAYEKGPNTFGGHAADAFMLVVKALGESGGDRAKTRAAIEGTRKFVGISGVFNMSPKDHNGLAKNCLAMIEIKNGKWTLAK